MIQGVGTFFIIWQQVFSKNRELIKENKDE